MGERLFPGTLHTCPKGPPGHQTEGHSTQTAGEECALAAWAVLATVAELCRRHGACTAPLPVSPAWSPRAEHWAPVPGGRTPSSGLWERSAVPTSAHTGLAHRAIQTQRRQPADHQCLGSAPGPVSPLRQSLRPNPDAGRRENPEPPSHRALTAAWKLQRPHHAEAALPLPLARGARPTQGAAARRGAAGQGRGRGHGRQCRPLHLGPRKVGRETQGTISEGHGHLQSRISSSTTTGCCHEPALITVTHL